MSSSRGVTEQGLYQADGTMLVVKNCFLEVVDICGGLNRSKSDGYFGRAVGTYTTRADAVQDARDNSGSLATGDDEPARSSATSPSHSTVSEPAPPSPGSSCSSADGISDVGQFKIGGSRLNGGVEAERLGSSGPASSGPSPEVRCPRREPAGRRGAEVTSSGERSHAIGTCRPCIYFRTKAGCANGLSCGYCHLPHAVKRRSRPRKAVRDLCKERLAMLDDERGVDVAAVRGLADNGVSAGIAHQYMRSILRARHRQHDSLQRAAEAPFQSRRR